METIKINLTIPDNKRVVDVSLTNDNEISVNLDTKFKDGDFVISDKSQMFIYAGEDEITYHCYVGEYGKISGIPRRLDTGYSSHWCRKKGTKYRLATSEEKEEFLDFMHSNGYDWDAENKKVIKYRWRAKKYGRFYYIDEKNSLGTFEVVPAVDNFSSMDDNYYENHNYFKTKEEAQEVVDKINNIFREL